MIKMVQNDFGTNLPWLGTKKKKNRFIEIRINKGSYEMTKLRTKWLKWVQIDQIQNKSG